MYNNLAETTRWYNCMYLASYIMCHWGTNMVRNLLNCFMAMRENALMYKTEGGRCFPV